MRTAADAYSARAAEYTDLLGSIAAVDPEDLQIVNAWAGAVQGRVLDAGCGPGHWTNHLAGLGLDTRGIDITAAFIHHARATYPGIPFDVASIDEIDEEDGALGGVMSWFSTIHHEPEAITTPIAEFARVLRPGGTLLLGFFSAAFVESFDHAVLRAYRWPAEELHNRLVAAGLTPHERHIRETPGSRPVGAIVATRTS